MKKAETLRIGILAGEASGDLLGAKLIQALHTVNPLLEIEGIGGPAMIAAGCNSLFDIDELAVMGLIEPLLHLPRLYQLRKNLYRHFKANPPDLFIGIDAPDFNIGLELKLRKLGIPVVHYVSPSVWAWRQYRIHKIKKAVDLMLTLFPFEAAFYEQNKVPVRYIGHPLAESIPLQPDTKAARRTLCLNENDTYIAILPGSRRQEIKLMAEPFLLAAKQIWEKLPHVKFITTHVNEKRYQEFYQSYKQHVPDLPLTFFTRRSQDVIGAADTVIVTSGTATLETMLLKKPMVIAYRMSPLTFQLAKLLVKTPYAGLPNLLANEMIVPELIQDAATPAKIAEPILNYLNDQQATLTVKEKFTALHSQLIGLSSNCIAENILAIIQKNS